MRQHNVAPTYWQFSNSFDTHVNLSELLQNSWSEAESVLSTAGVKAVKNPTKFHLNKIKRSFQVQLLDTVLIFFLINEHA